MLTSSKWDNWSPTYVKHPTPGPLQLSPIAHPNPSVTFLVLITATCLLAHYLQHWALWFLQQKTTLMHSFPCVYFWAELV